MALIIDIKVNPSSGMSKIILDKSGGLKAYLKSPAQDGKANAELIKLLAAALAVPQRQITILAGLISRKKKIKINEDLTLNALIHKLGLEIQSSLL